MIINTLLIAFSCDLSDKLDRSYFEKHPQLKEFMEKHADIGTYHNSFWKCEDQYCVCGTINSPIEVFRKVKKDGILRPIESQTPEHQKYLDYEETEE